MVEVRVNPEGTKDPKSIEEQDLSVTPSRRVKNSMSYILYGKCLQNWRRQHEVIPLSDGESKGKPQQAKLETPEETSDTEEQVVSFLIEMHPRAKTDQLAADRLRRQFLRASPDKQYGVVKAAIATAEKEGRRDLLNPIVAKQWLDRWW